ncbi:hypothetical protein Tco_0890822 [Tanacetum coccineum]|uniref:Uncharacterized protein n=1 Tax=Tanacetum coccineum TaxID=301880 RepID=A0ABQ5C1J1_9ASTR
MLFKLDLQLKRRFPFTSRRENDPEGGKTGGFDHITNKDAIILYSLANGINIDYASIFWEDIIIKLNKRHREKVVPYTRFLSLLMMHKMKKVYGDGKVTPYPTQVFSVNNWALKPNQPEEPIFTDHMLAICNAIESVVFKAPKPSSNAKRVPQGTNPEAKPRHKKHSTSSKQPFVSSKEATKGGSSKAPTGSKTSHLKRKKESSSAMDSNPSQTSVSTLVVAEMHKKDQQATGGPTSLGVTSEARANPHLSSVVSTTKADPGKFALSTDPHVLKPKGRGFIQIQRNHSKIIKTYELGHEHKFITEIMARRANDCIVSITEPDYKNLNKNDIEDIVHQEFSDIGKSARFSKGIEEYDVFSIVYEPVHGIIYTNSKKEKRVMRPSEIHKFCDATLRRTLEGLKSYYNDVKYGYVQKELTNDEVEFLKLFEEEIEVRLNYRDQMRRWEMYVNGRPLGPRRERPE